MKTISELTLKYIYESMVNRYFTEKTRLLNDLDQKQSELSSLRANRDRRLKELQSSKNIKEAAVLDMTKKTATLVTEISSLSDSIVKSMLLTELSNLNSEKEQKLFDARWAIRDLDNHIVDIEHEIAIETRKLNILDGQYPIFIGLTMNEAKEKYETFIQI
jgi:hypothetical protein